MMARTGAAAQRCFVQAHRRRGCGGSGATGEAAAAVQEARRRQRTGACSPTCVFGCPPIDVAARAPTAPLDNRFRCLHGVNEEVYFDRMRSYVIKHTVLSKQPLFWSKTTLSPSRLYSRWHCGRGVVGPRHDGARFVQQGMQRFAEKEGILAQ